MLLIFDLTRFLSLATSPPADFIVLDLVVLIVFIGVGIASWHFRISYRKILVFGLFLLLIAAIAIAFHQEGVGNFSAILAYYSLVVGVLLGILEYVRGGGSKKNLVEDPAGRAITREARPLRLRARLLAPFRRQR